jgi:hypothetical protein
MKTTSNVVKGHSAEAIRYLEEALTGGNAHASFDDAVRDLPHDLLGAVPAGLPYRMTIGRSRRRLPNPATGKNHWIR